MTLFWYSVRHSYDQKALLERGGDELGRECGGNTPFRAGIAAVLFSKKTGSKSKQQCAVKEGTDYDFRQLM